MKHTEFERKKTVNTPLLNRAKTILLKQAICQAETDMLQLIGTGVSLANIEAAVGGLRDAKYTLKIALQDGFLSYRAQCDVMEILVRLQSGIRLQSLHEAIGFALELHEVTPQGEPAKYGIPHYRPTDATFVCKCGEPLTIREEIERGFCINCAYGYNENGDA
jgi:hypothetical protein